MTDDLTPTKIFEQQFSALQSKRAKKRRQRTSLARTAVRYVLREAPMFPGVRSQSNVVAQNDWDARYAEKGSNHGRSLSRYRHFVGCECRLLGKSIDIEVTVIEDEQGRPASHEFFCCDTFRRESIADSTLRRIVKQVARDLGQE